jgi:uncharacterized protein YndB with AHSA1/START domain
MTATPTGRLERRGDDDVVVFTRTFSAPIDDVWAAVTESDRLARWIGTWTGDPADGFVMFQMNAEGDEAAESRCEIRTCEPPRHLLVHTLDEYGSWTLDLALAEDAGVTTLTMGQVIDDPAMVENTGPGWDYYLDRLVAAETGGDPGTIDFDRDYYPAQREYYQAIADQITSG